jgi:ATP synthase protein I
MSPLDAHTGDASRLLAVQAGLVAVVAVGFWFTGGLLSVQAAAYGGGIALLTTFLLGRRVRMAMDAAKQQPGSETTVLMVGVVQRFVLALALLGAGIGWLGLEPVPLLVGLAVGQMAFFFSRTTRPARS